MRGPSTSAPSMDDLFPTACRFSAFSEGTECLCSAPPLGGETSKDTGPAQPAVTTGAEGPPTTSSRLRDGRETPPCPDRELPGVPPSAHSTSKASRTLRDKASQPRFPVQETEVQESKSPSKVTQLAKTGAGAPTHVQSLSPNFSGPQSPRLTSCLTSRPVRGRAAGAPHPTPGSE